MYYEDRNRGFQQSTAPVQVGDEIDVTVEAVGEKGDGIAKKKGFVLFIPNTRQGERIRIRVTKVLSKVGFAEKIGDASSAPESGAAAGQESASVRQETPAEPSPEDTEDFGEEEPPEEESEDFSMLEGDEDESAQEIDEDPSEEEKKEE